MNSKGGNYQGASIETFQQRLFRGVAIMEFHQAIGDFFLDKSDPQKIENM